MLIVIVGGGPVGALAGIYMATRHHHNVIILERQHDLQPSNRSINLALSHRGIEAIKTVDNNLYCSVIKAAVPVKGRMIHLPDGEDLEHEYGCFGECIYSIDRHFLNQLLLDRATECCSVRFDCKVIDLHFDKNNTVQVMTEDGDCITCDLVIGCDGVHSRVRRCIAPLAMVEKSTIQYKEIEIPKNRNLDQNYLHIWPHPPNHMFMALPNQDGTFTATFFSETIVSVDEIMTSYKHMLPIVHIDELLTEWTDNPFGNLYVVDCHEWHHDEKAVVIGDAAHGMLPFYGQGLNAGLEDVRLLSEFMDQNRSLEEFTIERQIDTAAMQKLSFANWKEMNGGELAWLYNLKRMIVRGIHCRFPKIATPLYTMLAFTDTPYHDAVRKDAIQGHFIKLILLGLLGTLIYSLTWSR